jgi:uncharacterized protein
MRVIVEVLHPAHVHVFRNAIGLWRERGDEVLVLSRKKEVANELLEAYGIHYESISELKRGKLSLVGEMVVRDVRMLTRALSFRPDVLVGVMGVTIVQVGKVIARPAVVFYDTENAGITNSFVYPLAHSVCTPDCYEGTVRGRHVTYPSYHELAYLHPRRFTPDPSVVFAAGLEPGSYFLLRFVSWQASHDVGERGFDLAMKRRWVEAAQKHGRVLISSEGSLPEDLESLRFRAPPEQMHHFIAHARMLVGESATMASEAAVLGVPAFYIADTGRGYTTHEQTRYGLVWNYKGNEGELSLAKFEELCADPNLGATMASARARLLEERIDLTAWMVEYVDSVVSENRPQERSSLEK